MSRYTLLLLMNLPFIMAGILGVITQNRLGKSSKSRLMAQLFLWLVILGGLILAEPVYEWLYGHHLTQTEPLSLFDVIQITAIIITFYVATRTRTKLEDVERRINDLHQELSIRLSKK